MKRVFFITGTDTGVGKTFASGVLGSYYKNKGNVLYIKPVQTGYPPDSDAEYISKNFNIDSRTILDFKLPASPHLAAQLENRNIDLLDLVFKIKQIINQTNYNYYLIEGAGGLLVPINNQYKMIDLLLKINPSKIFLVSRPTLGTLNHTALSLFLLRNYRIPKSHINIIFSLSENIDISDNIIVKDNLNFFKNEYKTFFINYNSNLLEEV